MGEFFRLFLRWLVVVCGLLVGALTSLGGCGGAPGRACERDEDCAKSAPLIFCFRGACSNFMCDEGETRKCYEGPDGTEGKGACKGGQMFCLKTRVWSACEGQKTPVPEHCDRQDNDCDGKTDEDGDCTCEPGSRRLCYAGPPETQGQGLCQMGLQYCEDDNRWSKCEGEILPQPETCDKKDNDCNGLIDDSLLCACKPGEQRSCYSGGDETLEGGKPRGACKEGMQSCGVNRQWGACFGEVKPVAERCDSQDNDCDGEVDEGCECKPGEQRPCYSHDEKTADVGTCRKGIQTCGVDNKWALCLNEQGPQAELCNDKDDNCDGQVDERFVDKDKACQVGQGSCLREGKMVCGSGGDALRCSVTPGDPTPEICDGKDNDCDGEVDETWPTLGKPCEDGVGACRESGEFVCNDAKDGVRCSAKAKAPGPESCDGKDNDCDGEIDEDFATLGQACSAGLSACRTTGKFVCNANQDGVACDAKADLSRQQPETCDGKDNNCDGKIDENCKCQEGTTRSCYTGPAGTAGKGNCKAGSQRCETSGWGACAGEVLPATETCNGRDDNCDGNVDEGLTRSCYSGPARTLGVGPCKGGTQTCTNGTWGACQGEVTPQNERCDEKDNDCDGKTDENWLVGISCRVGLGECRREGKRICQQDQTGTTCSVQPGPSTPEICDGKDNNCNGLTDEKWLNKGLPCVAGKGLCIRVGVYVCNQAQTDTVCNAQVPQGESEQCGDLLDNDCDGLINEDCRCLFKKQACYSGPPSTKDVGECKSGEQICVLLGVIAGKCEGEVLPQPEICDKKDNDCNGKVDDNISCP